MSEGPAQTFQRLVAENRELLEKLQNNQHEMEQLANYMLSIELEGSNGSIKSKAKSQPSEFGRDGSVRLSLDAISAAKSNSHREDAHTALISRGPRSVGYHDHSNSSRPSPHGSNASVKRLPSGDSMRVNPPESRLTGTVRFIPAPLRSSRPSRPGSPEPPTPYSRSEREHTIGERERSISALEAREEIYGPEDRWYLPSSGR